MIEAFNDSFNTPQNIDYWNYVLDNYCPNPEKPLIFMPCAAAHKTREKYGKKRISKSVSHVLLKPIAQNDQFEKVIISEPLTVIPYSLEDNMPDYNYPPKLLLKRTAELKTFITRLSFFLTHIKSLNPKRDIIHYIGGKHHYKILIDSNNRLDNPFKIIYWKPKRGLLDYRKKAIELNHYLTNQKLV